MRTRTRTRTPTPQSDDIMSADIKIVFDHVTFIKVKGQIYACRKIFPRLRTAKYGLKPSNNKGDIQGRQ